MFIAAKLRKIIINSKKIGEKWRKSEKKSYFCSRLHVLAMQIANIHLKFIIMTRFELIKANQTMLKAMVDNKISPGEVKNLEIYEEFKARKAKKEKISYIVCCLKEKYNLTERRIYGIIKQMAKRINL